MTSLPILTVLEQYRVSPPPATVTDTSLPLTFFDILYLLRPPIHLLVFYNLPLTTDQFLETIVSNLKHSLSITLQHVFPYAGDLIVFPDRTRKPEIRYVEGASVNVTFAECNLDFRDLTGYHPRECDKFYHLIPLLGDCRKISEFVKIPVFSAQVTVFPNCGISIGMTTHHTLGDAATQFSFLNAWASIARCGTDESFLANGTLPVYERLVNHPEQDEQLLNRTNLDAFNEDYQLPKLSGPTDKVRATFSLTRTFINTLKKSVLANLPTLPYVSSFTVVCAYMWHCLAQSRDDERQMFIIPINYRAHLDPPIPAEYFRNCTWGSTAISKTADLTGKEGFMVAVKLIGENLHETLMDKDGLKDGFGNAKSQVRDLLADGIPTTMIVISGTPKVKLYEVDFGWGKPEKVEKVSMDYGATISIDAGKESDQDFEIGVNLTATQMEAFVRVFNLGLETHV